jgi:nicotinamide mononucleotide transporter
MLAAPACSATLPAIPGFPCDSFELAAAVVGAVSVWFSVRESIWSWPTGIVNVLMYVWVFLCARLYADMGLQVVYAGISVYGWWHWLHGGAERSELPVSRMPAGYRLPLGVAVVAAAALLGALLHRTTDAALPWADASLTCASLAAQWMLSRKYLENWLVWIVADVAYVAMFAYKRLWCTAILYAVFLALAMAGWRAWRRTLAAAATPSHA